MQKSAVGRSDSGCTRKPSGSPTTTIPSRIAARPFAAWRRPPTERFAEFRAATITALGKRLKDMAAAHAPTKNESNSRFRNSAARVSLAFFAAK